MVLGHFVVCLSSPLSDPSDTKLLDARSIAASRKKRTTPCHIVNLFFVEKQLF